MQDEPFWLCHKCGKIFSGRFLDVHSANIGYSDNFELADEKISPGKLNHVFFCDRCFEKLRKDPLEEMEFFKSESKRK